MDQEKIGKFIAEQRKKNNLTQAQLAEKLGISDRAISKWENGKSMPDSSIMIELCKILNITTTDLLIGEKLEGGDSAFKSQELLLKMSEEVAQKNKIIWTNMWVIMTICLIAFLGGAFVVAQFMEEGVWQLVAILTLVILFIIPCFYALKLEVSVGAYQCKICGEKIEPTYNEALWAMHMGTTRFLKCPKCKKRCWCKKVLKK